MAEGQPPEDIAPDFPQLTAADVIEALTLAAETLHEREVALNIGA